MLDIEKTKTYTINLKESQSVGLTEKNNDCINANRCQLRWKELVSFYIRDKVDYEKRKFHYSISFRRFRIVN